MANAPATETRDDGDWCVFIGNNLPQEGRTGPIAAGPEVVRSIASGTARASAPPRAGSSALPEVSSGISGEEGTPIRNYEDQSSLSIEGPEACDDAPVSAESKDKENEKAKEIKKGPKYKPGNCHVKDDWFKRVDSNGDNVNSYLRPVSNNPYKVFCGVDDSYIQCKWRGFAAV